MQKKLHTFVRTHLWDSCVPVCWRLGSVIVLERRASFTSSCTSGQGFLLRKVWTPRLQVDEPECRSDENPPSLRPSQCSVHSSSCRRLSPSTRSYQLLHWEAKPHIWFRCWESLIYSRLTLAAPHILCYRCDGSQTRSSGSGTDVEQQRRGSPLIWPNHPATAPQASSQLSEWSLLMCGWRPQHDELVPVHKRSWHIWSDRNVESNTVPLRPKLIDRPFAAVLGSLSREKYISH